MDLKNGKPIVRYNANTRYDDLYIELGKRGYVYALDHPRLGRQDVHTSQVLEIFTTHDGIQAFETLYTNYVLDTYVIPE